MKVQTMSASRFHIALCSLLLLAGIGCDKVKDTPQPNTFQALQTSTIDIATLEGDTADFDLMATLKVKDKVNVTVAQPANGILIYVGTIGRYRYRPATAFVGTDSCAYTLCKESDCKTGKLRFVVTRKPRPECTTQLVDDTLRLLASNLTINTAILLRNDSICGIPTVPPRIQSVGNSDFGHVTLSGQNIILNLPPLGQQLQRVNFQYVVFSEGRSYTATVRVSITRDREYCASGFNLLNSFLTFDSQGTAAADVSQLARNYTGCPDDLMPDTFFELNPPSPSDTSAPYIYRRVRNQLSFQRRHQGPQPDIVFKYTFRSRSGKTDTAKITLLSR